MEGSVLLCRLALVLAMNMILAGPSNAQIRTPCSALMIYSFTPCIGFLTNSSPNGTLPTAQCCDSLNSLTSGGMNCLCLIVTGNVPFTIPINRTLAISLPQACNIPGVPLQCKTSGSPLPAPGPVSLGLSPSAPSGFTPSPSPEASSVLPSPITPSKSPESDRTPLLTPPSPPVDNSDTPSTASAAGRSSLTPSSAVSSYSLPPSFLLIASGFLVLKCY